MSHGRNEPRMSKRLSFNSSFVNSSMPMSSSMAPRASISPGTAAYNNASYAAMSIESLRITQSDQAKIDQIRLKKLSEKELEENYSYVSLKSQNVLRSGMKYVRKYYKPSPMCMKNYFYKRLPFFSWILKYNIREDLLKDIIAGLTLGIVHIPQNMAYSLMAGVPAINGLYVAFFNVLLYIILGTSRHISTGTYAIVSLMVVSNLKKFDGYLYPPYNENEPETHHNVTIHRLLTNLTTTTRPTTTASESSHHMNILPAEAHYISHDPVQGRVLTTMAMAILVGIIHIGFAILHVGVVTKYLSDAIVNGFTIGAAYHVVTSQINTLLGITLGESDLPFVMIGEYIQIFENIIKTNICTLIISIASCIFLYVIKHFVNEKYKTRMPAPIPVELLLVIFGTLISHFCKLSTTYKIKTVGYLPLGIPKPTVPPMSVFSEIFKASMAIAIVSFALNISIAKLYAKKHKYQINPNQELFAYGIGNIVSGFFQGIPSCVGLSRTVIVDNVGGRTQVAGIFSVILILIAILFLGPLFRDLPNACLAAIIVVALKDMIFEVKSFPALLKKNKMEGLAWLTTFLGVFILNVDVGLYIGVGFSLLLVILRTQRARTSVLGNIPGTSIYEDVNACDEAKEFQNIKIIRFEESIYYANVDNFKYKIIKLCGINPEEVLAQVRKEQVKASRFAKKNLKNQKVKSSETNDDVKSFQDDAVVIIENQFNRQRNGTNTLSFNNTIKHLIIDCSCINFIDSQGANAIVYLYESYKEIGIELYLTYCKRAVLKTLKKLSFHQLFDLDHIYPSNSDAVHNIMKTYQERARSPSTMNTLNLGEETRSTLITNMSMGKRYSNAGMSAIVLPPAIQTSTLVSTPEDSPHKTEDKQQDPVETKINLNQLQYEEDMQEEEEDDKSSSVVNHHNVEDDDDDEIEENYPSSVYKDDESRENIN